MDLLVERCGPVWSPDPHIPYRMEELPGDCIVVRRGRVAWTGGSAAPEVLRARQEGMATLDAAGAMVLPGFVDSHTHPVFFEHRAAEYELRNAGRSYLEIQEAGGGILGSRRSLMAADPAGLKERVRARLRRFLALGTTTIEAKSGYGLSVEHELLSLSILRELAAEEPIGIHPTLLAAHGVPPEHRADRGEWFRLIREEILPVVAREGLAEALDAFCEPGVLSVEETEDLMRAGQELGLAVRLHAEQIGHGGGARLAARLGALSADHLEQVDEADIAALAAAGTVFGLLPGSTFFLGQREYAPARRIIAAGGRIALATDYNPGSSHIQSMPFILTLATCQLKMTAAEAIWSATMGGAVSLGRGDRLGCLRPGWTADLCLWPFSALEELPYTVGDNRPLRVVRQGVVLAPEAGYPNLTGLGTFSHG
ncbi:MAG: imidazolonepropionase [bacterium]|jgi:imidazolonepropionase|nr:imidazolonepropionase [bacterium]